jgi:hypothetical protein
MTKIQYIPDVMTDFSQWIRKTCKDSHLGLSVVNVDYILNEYKQKRLKIIEEKTHGKKIMDYPQTQVYKILDTALKYAEENLVFEYEYEGFFLITFSNTDPENSEFIYINGVSVTKEELLKFLNFEIRFQDLKRDPTSPVAPSA